MPRKLRPAKAEEPSGPSLTEVERPVLAFILPNVFIPKRYLLRMTTLTDRWEWDCGCGSMIDNHTPARGIMGLMQPKGLLSSPRAVDGQGCDYLSKYTVQTCAEKKDCFAKQQPSVAGRGWLQPGRNFLST